MAAGVDALNIISSSLPTISQGCVFPRPTDAEDHQLELLVQEGHLTQEPLPLEVNIPLRSTRGRQRSDSDPLPRAHVKRSSFEKKTVLTLPARRF